MIRVHLINESAKVTPGQAKDLATGLTKYGNMVAAAWHQEQVKVDVTGGDWEFHIVDQFPVGAPQNALGYHDLAGDKVVAYISTALTMPKMLAPDVNGNWFPSPFGTIISGVGGIPDTLMPGSLAEVLSHELAEAMVDPFVNRYAYDDAGKQFWLVEVGDHADAYGFVLTFGFRKVQMICQDFTLPSFYDGQGVAPFSYTGKVSNRFTLDKGGYAYTVAAGAVSTPGMDKD